MFQQWGAGQGCQVLLDIINCEVNGTMGLLFKDSWEYKIRGFQLDTLVLTRWNPKISKSYDFLAFFGRLYILDYAMSRLYHYTICIRL